MDKKQQQQQQQQQQHILNILQQDGRALDQFSVRVQRDPALVLTAVCQNAHALKYAFDNLKSDLVIVLTAVYRCGSALAHASALCQAKFEVVLIAVSKDRNALQYAGKNLLSCRQELEDMANSENPTALLEDEYPDLAEFCKLLVGCEDYKTAQTFLNDVWYW